MYRGPALGRTVQCLAGTGLRGMGLSQCSRRGFHANRVSIRGSSNGGKFVRGVGLSAGLAAAAVCLREESECQAPQTEATNASPFVYPELTKGLEWRESREKDLLELRAKARHRVFLLQQRVNRREISEEKFKLEMHKLKVHVNKEAQQLIFNVEDPDMREEYMKLYGCVKWTDEVLKEISGLGPIVEMGAGNGQWKAELESVWKVDIVAYDNFVQLPLAEAHMKSQVSSGDENAVSKHKDRTLLLVCPPPTEMPLNCVKSYRGKTVVFVGEGRGGAHGTDNFFDELEKNWEIVKVMEVEPFPECYEKCFILTRKKSWWWPF